MIVAPVVASFFILGAEPPPMPPPPPNPDRHDDACRDATGAVIPCLAPLDTGKPVVDEHGAPLPEHSDKPAEPLQADDGNCADKGEAKKEKGANVAAITGIVGSATGVAGALTAVVVGALQIPNPLDYWALSDQLQKSQIAFRKDPDVKFLKNADHARTGLRAIDNAVDKQLGLFVSSGLALATSGVGLGSSIAAVMQE